MRSRKWGQGSRSENGDRMKTRGRKTERKGETGDRGRCAREGEKLRTMVCFTLRTMVCFTLRGTK